MASKFSRIPVLGLNSIPSVFVLSIINCLNKHTVVNQTQISVTRWQTILPAFQSVLDRRDSDVSAWLVESEIQTSNDNLMMGDESHKNELVSSNVYFNENRYIENHHKYKTQHNRKYINNIYSTLQNPNHNRTIKIDNENVNFQWNDVLQNTQQKHFSTLSKPVSLIAKHVYPNVFHEMNVNSLPLNKLTEKLMNFNSNHQLDDTAIVNNKPKKIWVNPLVRLKQSQNVFLVGIQKKYNNFFIKREETSNNKSNNNHIALIKNNLLPFKTGVEVFEFHQKALEQVVIEKFNKFVIDEKQTEIDENEKQAIINSDFLRRPYTSEPKFFIKTPVVLNKTLFNVMPRIKKLEVPINIEGKANNDKANSNHKNKNRKKSNNVFFRITDSHINSQCTKEILHRGFSQRSQDHTRIDLHHQSILFKAQLAPVITTDHFLKNRKYLSPLLQPTSRTQPSKNSIFLSNGVSINRQNAIVRPIFLHKRLTQMQPLPFKTLNDERIQNKQSVLMQGKVNPSYFTHEKQSENTIQDLKNDVIDLKQTLLQWQDTLQIQLQQSQQQLQQQYQVLVSSVSQAKQPLKPIHQRPVHAPSFFDPL